MTSSPSDEPGSPSSPDPFGDSQIFSMPPPTAPPAHIQRTIPSLCSLSDPQTPGQSPNPLGPTNAARRPANTPFVSMPSFASGGSLPADVQARLRAFHASRRVPNPVMNGGCGLVAGGVPTASPIGGFGSPMMGGRMNRPAQQSWVSSPAITGRGPGLGGTKKSLMERRQKAFPGTLPGGISPPLGSGSFGGENHTNDTNGNMSGRPTGDGKSSLFDKYSEYVDAKTGSLKFAGKAVLHSKGVDFSSGSSFSISLDEVDIIEELGKGNYGTVYKVVHRKPIVSKIGEVVLPGKLNPPVSATSSPTIGSPTNGTVKSPTCSRQGAGGTNVEMAMKEIRLELDENKFAQIIMELDVLHRCVSPFIIDFYGAFFQEGAVYICMEYMDGGSIDKLYRDGVPEGVLRKITYATVMGLKTLKDDHNIIHRDVKPTNILVNSRGEIKLCDFGVSGNLVASKAKTNIGCQSYMAPERIATGGVQAALGGSAPGTYSVQSDIWSLGLSILECAMGCYPYPPETYNNIFSQLSAIVDGEPPDFPEEGFTPQARDFVRGCLKKVPGMRPAYAMLLRHPWLADLGQPPTITEEEELEHEAISTPPHGKGDKEVRDWVLGAIERRKSRIAAGGKGPESEKPALHAAPLDAVITPAKEGEIPVTETIVMVTEDVEKLGVSE